MADFDKLEEEHNDNAWFERRREKNEHSRSHLKLCHCIAIIIKALKLSCHVNFDPNNTFSVE